LVLAFGSRARGEALAESDLDLVVVSERFQGMPFLERTSRLLADLDVPFPVDLLCYTPNEFRQKRRELGIVRAAVAEGVRLDNQRGASAARGAAKSTPVRARARLGRQTGGPRAAQARKLASRRRRI